MFHDASKTPGPWLPPTQWPDSFTHTCLAGLAHAHKEVENRAGLSVRVHRMSSLGLKSKANMTFRAKLTMNYVYLWCLGGLLSGEVVAAMGS